MTLNTEDLALLDRLFGPRIPDEMAEIFEEAKGVQVARTADLPIALNALIQTVVHTGIGAGTVGGWRLYEAAGFTHLAVCVIKSARLRAA